MLRRFHACIGCRKWIWSIEVEGLFGFFFFLPWLNLWERSLDCLYMSTCWIHQNVAHSVGLRGLYFLLPVNLCIYSSEKHISACYKKKFHIWNTFRCYSRSGENLTTFCSQLVRLTTKVSCHDVTVKWWFNIDVDLVDIFGSILSWNFLVYGYSFGYFTFSLERFTILKGQVLYSANFPHHCIGQSIISLGRLSRNIFFRNYGMHSSQRIGMMESCNQLTLENINGYLKFIVCIVSLVDIFVCYH